MLHHHLLWWIVVGLVAGILARALVSGGNREPRGCIFTILLGIGGSVLTGLVMRYLLHDSGGGGLLGSICGATIGAIVLILLFRKSWQ